LKRSISGLLDQTRDRRVRGLYRVEKREKKKVIGSVEEWGRLQNLRKKKRVLLK